MNQINLGSVTDKRSAGIPLPLKRLCKFRGSLSPRSLGDAFGWRTLYGRLSLMEPLRRTWTAQMLSPPGHAGPRPARSCPQMAGLDRHCALVETLWPRVEKDYYKASFGWNQLPGVSGVLLFSWGRWAVLGPCLRMSVAHRNTSMRGWASFTRRRGEKEAGPQLGLLPRPPPVQTTRLDKLPELAARSVLSNAWDRECLWEMKFQFSYLYIGF